MKLDIPQRFWKGYIEADYMKKEKILKPIIKNLDQTSDLLAELKQKGRRYDKNRQRIMLMFLQSYFDDLIDTMRILNENKKI